MTVEEILWWIGGVEMPKGDADKARQAAAVWGRLADRLESSIKTTDPIAADVWGNNSGEGIDAFQKFWREEFAPYPREVAAYCRRVEAVCNGYAHALDVTKFALTVLAIQTYLNILYTIAYGWVGGWAGTLAELTVIRKWALVRAQVQKTLFQRVMIKLLGWIYDSLAYAGGQQLLQIGVFRVADLFDDHKAETKEIIGYDPYSVEKNGKQFGEAAVANFVFDVVADGAVRGMTQVGPWGRYLSAGSPSGWRPRMVGFTARMIGSNVYTVVNNAMEGKPIEDWLPTWRQEVDKLIAHGARIAKNPAKGPIGHWQR